MERAASAAGVRWKKNALRHSYISHRLAITRNKGQLAEECGNSEQVIQTNYKALVTPSAAARWFAITPPGDNIVALPTSSSGLPKETEHEDPMELNDTASPVGE